MCDNLVKIDDILAMKRNQSLARERERERERESLFAISMKIIHRQFKQWQVARREQPSLLATYEK